MLFDRLEGLRHGMPGRDRATQSPATSDNSQATNCQVGDRVVELVATPHNSQATNNLITSRESCKMKYT